MTSLDLSEEHTKLEPTEKEKILSKYFELQLTEVALRSYKEKDFLKAAMLSWSYIEEYFLPTQIEFVAINQNMKLDKDFLKNLTSFHLIRYYYLISYDREMYDVLEHARKLRNKMTHNKSIASIEKMAQESADYNLGMIDAMLDREEGKIVAPSLLIAINARNDLRKEQRERLGIALGS